MARDGLTAKDAAARLAADGPNELPRTNRRTAFRILVDVVREPMLALLLVGGLIYLLLGEPRDSLVLLAFALLSVVITLVQELRTERVLEALRDLTSPRALVIRDGATCRIAGREVVRDDLLLLAEGDRVPADATLIEATDLLLDESLLTGESVPVSKRTVREEEPLDAAQPGGEGLPYVFSGTLVTRGHGLASVSATGPRSAIGRIGVSLEAVKSEAPRLQAQTRRLVVIFAIAGFFACLAAVLLSGFIAGDWLKALLGGIALGMSMLPEEFPVVLTVFLAMGAWRISKARVLTRRAAAIEALGSATVLCTDKTGTLTENRMRISELRLAGGDSLVVPAEGELPPDFAALVRTGTLASAINAVDPMERAFHDRAVPTTLSGRTLVRTYGLRPDLLAIVQGWQAPGEDGYELAAKGAPEAIAGLCGLEGEALAQLKAEVDRMATRGLRVLGVARGRQISDDWPETQRDLALEFMGLVGLADPLRASVPEAVRQCREAGIRVIMITGDYPATARAIAAQAGIDGAHVLTGSDLATLSDTELREAVRTTTVFARIMPDQKLRIVSALKANGEIVAMTGDGVNDAPSLKAADIGVAMGGRGTDVAREASSIVLLDDDFGAIVAAVRLGRRIYDNLLKAMEFIFAVHFPIAGLALMPLALGHPLVLLPIHIAFLEMVIDPVSSLVFEAEPEESNLMRRSPRPVNERLFGRRRIIWSALQGLLTFAAVGIVYFTGWSAGLSAEGLRGLTFLAMLLAIIALVLVNRSFSSALRGALSGRNQTLVWILSALLGLIVALYGLPILRDLFDFAALGWREVLVALAAALGLFAVLEAIKHQFGTTIR